MRTLFFDCFAGASGNMVLGALIAAGVKSADIESGLAKLNVEGISLETTNVDRSGISAIHVGVNAPDSKKHRHLHHIEAIINESQLSTSVKTRALKIFGRLAVAEAAVHGIEVQKVHFHEVGALDAIADVVGACIGFEILGIESFRSSAMNTGCGFVSIEHGTYPVPPPAVVELLKNVPIYSNGVEGELVTPTGAAIISTVCDSYGPLPNLTLEATGYGAGTRTYERFPNALRIFIGEVSENGISAEASDSDEIVVLETNIDDASPQVLGFVMERLLDHGALDCWFTPIQMKKNRPAVMLSVLCIVEDVETLSSVIFAETTTLGVRRKIWKRETLSRENISVSTKFGAVDVKAATIDDKIVNVMPEYEQVKAAAMRAGVPFRVVRDETLAAFENGVVDRIQN